MLRSSLPLSLFALAIAATGCSTDNTTSPNPMPSSGTTVSFQTQVAPIFEANCAPCHQQGGSDARKATLLDSSGKASYSGIKASLNLAVRDMQNGSMPQGGTRIGTSQLSLIQTWQSQGAQNN